MRLLQTLQRSGPALPSLTTKLKKAFGFLKPPERLAVDEWADTYRKDGGKDWEVSEVEVARGPMRAVTEPGVRTITGMAGTQLFKTELILNTIGRFAHLDPCPILVVQPKIAVSEKFSKERLAPLIRDTPVLRAIFGSGKTRDTSNTLLYKKFTGGSISVVTAGSPADLAMMAIRIVCLDEVDKFPESSGSEGDPVGMAEERMAKYSHNSLSIRVCSPTDAVTSRINRSYGTSDQRKPHVACPHCGTWQHMQFRRGVKCPRDPVTGEWLFDAARYHCVSEKCPSNVEGRAGGTGWTEVERRRVVTTRDGIRWLQTAPFTCCSAFHHPAEWDPNGHDLVDEETGEVLACEWDDVGHALCPHCRKPAPNEHAGFGHVSKLYYPRRTMAELFRKWIEAQGDINALRLFINTQLGEVFEEQGETLEPVYIMERIEEYDADMPYGACIATAGVDVQADRIELEFVGWGADEESWSLGYHVIHGDTVQPYVWIELARLLKSSWVDGQGRSHMVQAAVIDANYRTPKVVDFIIQNPGRRWYAGRGDRQEVHRRAVWPSRAGKAKHRNFDIYTIGLAAAKDQVMGRLAIPEEGPGFCHFPKRPEVYNEGYFEQLTAEIRVTRRSGTTTYYAWKPRRAGIRNEAHDCRVYAYAALESLKAGGINVNAVAAKFGYTSRMLEGHLTEHPNQRKGRVDTAPTSQVNEGPVLDPPLMPEPPRKSATGKKRIVKKHRPVMRRR